VLEHIRRRSALDVVSVDEALAVHDKAASPVHWPSFREILLNGKDQNTVKPNAEIPARKAMSGLVKARHSPTSLDANHN